MNAKSLRVFGVVPAAGRSRRMGEPKQLLDVGGRPMLLVVIDALLDGGLDRMVVVTNSQVNAALKLDQDGRFVTAIAPDPDAEMLESVLIGIEAVAASFHPDKNDGIAVSPGDVPGLASELVRACAEDYRAHAGHVVVAAAGERTGHPIIIPFSMRDRLQRYRGVGLKQILADHRDTLRRVQVASPSVFADINTPEDRDELQRRAKP